MSRINKATFALMQVFEGLSLKAYHDSIDPLNIDTIGYGTIQYPPYYMGGKMVKVGDPAITQLQALDFFFYEAKQKETQLYPLLPSSMNDNQFGAILSFCYQEGISAFEKSTLRQKILADPNDPAIQLEFDKWVYSNKMRVEGIATRRKSEYKLYTTPV